MREEVSSLAPASVPPSSATHLCGDTPQRPSENRIRFLSADKFVENRRTNEFLENHSLFSGGCHFCNAMLAKMARKLARGNHEGEHKKTIETALGMLYYGMPKDKVAEISGLFIAEVGQLQNTAPKGRTD